MKDGTDLPENTRFDLQVIASWIDPGSRVLDLGCGNGDLLFFLKQRKGVRGTGIELSEDKTAKCIERGLTVLQGDFQEEVHDYPDLSFDYVVLSQTLQQILAPQELIPELLRIGRRVIVSFPNFGHWLIRMQILFTGHAPITDQLPYEWYDTPNIRVLSLRDFENFARQAGFKLLKKAAINTKNHQMEGKIVTFLPNLFATYGIFLIGHP